MVEFEKSHNVSVNNPDGLDRAVELIANREFVMARDFLLNIVDAGFDGAYVLLGQTYELEPEVNPILDYKKAHFYYLNAIEKTGDIEGHLGVARMLRLGNLGEIDYEGALQIYLYLIEKGLNAQGFLFFIVGVMYYEGSGVLMDRLIAKRYFYEAGEFGHIPSLTMLAHILFKEKAYLEAFRIKAKSIPIAIYCSFFDPFNPKTRMQ